MSHYSVLVVGEDVEKALYPFWELDLSREDLIKDDRAVFKVECSVEELDAHYQKWKDGADEEERKRWADLIEKYDAAEHPAKAWMDDWHGYDLNAEETHYGYYHNPNKKWDWYSIGGRWGNSLALKKGVKGTEDQIGRAGLFSPPPMVRERDGHEWVDQARARDVDWDAMLEDSIAEARKNWEAAEGASEQDRYWKYGIQKDQTLESYIASRSSLFFAVLKDGEWHEKGQMGWWAIVIDEKSPGGWAAESNEVIGSIGPDELVTVVDCHI
jgi:hypothetical protein